MTVAHMQFSPSPPSKRVLPLVRSLKRRSSDAGRALNGFVPFSPLGKGYLTGKIDENTTLTALTSATPYLARRSSEGEPGVGRPARQHRSGRTPRPPRSHLPGCCLEVLIVPIPGTTKLHRLQENVAAAAVELSEADLQDIDRAASQITVQGARYSESAQRMINR